MLAGAGAVLGFVLGLYGVLGLAWPAWALPLCVVGGWAAVYFVVLSLYSTAGRAAGTLYNPSGRSTPRAREHSYAESLVARGRYEEAITAFELAVHEDPTEAAPYLRIARIYRDRLGRLEDAARWFRRACREASLTSGQELLARRELIELYTGPLGQPARAAPELARLAEERAGTPEGEWAREELGRVKKHLRGEERG